MTVALTQAQQVQRCCQVIVVIVVVVGKGEWRSWLPIPNLPPLPNPKAKTCPALFNTKV